MEDGGWREGGGGQSSKDQRPEKHQNPKTKHQRTSKRATRRGGQSTPHPRPVASQAHHKMDAPSFGFASRNVVPDQRGEGEEAPRGCRTKIEQNRRLSNFIEHYRIGEGSRPRVEGRESRHSARDTGVFLAGARNTTTMRRDSGGLRIRTTVNRT